MIKIKDNAIGYNIRKVRLDNNLSIKDFAKKLKISKNKLKNIEDGKILPDLSVIKKICDKNCVNLNYLLNNNNVESDEELFGYFVELYEYVYNKEKKLKIIIWVLGFVVILLILINLVWLFFVYQYVTYLAIKCITYPCNYI